MITWCSYCQQFVGEVPPYDCLDFTHVLCASCAPAAEGFSETDVERVSVLQALQSRLADAGRSGDLETAQQVIDAAGAFGLRPVDTMIGVLAPVLYQIGEDWKRGTISIAEEHRFTAFCERMFHLVAANTAKIVNDHDTQADVLLILAPGNRHTLAGRILGLWLASKGIPVRMLDQLVGSDALVDVIERTEPKFLLISMALIEQAPSVIAIVERIASLSETVRPRIIVGGAAVKEGHVSPIAGATLVANVASLVQKLGTSD